ncbi:MAG: DUF1631 domain-containing protein [Rhodocyclaceae bacterium]|nr:DUF1631 domain-containing protein [Rhodocyclaceae bacterium]
MGQKSDKVVNLGAALAAAAGMDGSRRAAPSGTKRRVLTDCQDFSLRRLRGSLEGMLKKIEEELVTLADAELDRDTRKLYDEARGRARVQWRSIEEAFIDTVQKHYEGVLSGGVKRGATSLDELKLVDEEELSQDLALNEVAGHLKERCEDDLFALSQRFGTLLGRPNPNDEDNPIGPDAVRAGLKSACERIEGSVQMRLVFLKLLEKQVSEEISSLYRDLNTRLIEMDVLPDLRRGHRGDKRASAQHAAAPESRADSAEKAGDLPDLPKLPGAGDDDWFARLRGQVSAAGGMAEGLPGGFGAPGGMGADAGQLAASTADFMQNLSALQRAVQQLPGTFAAAPLGMGGADLPGVSNVLHNLRDSQTGQQLPPLDAITVDIIAMLFDFIFDDEQIADPIKALVGRLQIPVLKAAMLDRSFFSSRHHPVRRLLEGISRAAIAAGRNIGHNDALYVQLSFMIARIQDEFESDLSIFDSVLSDLETFLANQAEHEAEVAERSSRLVEHLERKELAAEAADRAMAAKAAAGVPEVVRQFLLACWNHRMQAAWENGGEEGEAWQLALQTATDLVWSVMPKANAEERKQLVQLLPTLLRRLNQSLDEMDVPVHEKRAFLDALVLLHSSVVRPGAAMPAADAAALAVPVMPAPPPVTVPSISVSRTGDGEVEVDSISAELPAGFEMPMTRIDRLARGDWVEFTNSEGERTRGRLSWISPRRSLFLFTNPQSPRALSLTPEALALQFQRGDAQMLDDAPMFERAVRKALETAPGE